MPVTSSHEAVQIYRSDPIPKTSENHSSRSTCASAACPLKPAHAERRSQPRCPFTAAATILEPKSGARIESHTTDLCLGGCYVDTMNPFPVGTKVSLRLLKDGKLFQSGGRVACCQLGMGMGIAFEAVEPVSRSIVERWFAELRGEAAPEKHTLEQRESACDRNSLKDTDHYALEELLLLLMRKGVLTEEDGQPILRRLIG